MWRGQDQGWASSNEGHTQDTLFVTILSLCSLLILLSTAFLLYNSHLLGLCGCTYLHVIPCLLLSPAAEGLDSVWDVRDSSWACSCPDLESATTLFKRCLLWALTLTLKMTFFQDSHYLHSQVVFPLPVRIKFRNASFHHFSYLLRGDIVGKESPEFSKVFSLGLASSSCNCEAAALGANPRHLYVCNPTMHLLSEIPMKVS